MRVKRDVPWYLTQPTEAQREFILNNGDDMSYSELARRLRVPRWVATKWANELAVNCEKQWTKIKPTFETEEELREHYHILCIWILRGFTIKDILKSYCGAVTEDDIIKAITYDDGSLFKKVYIQIKFAGNDCEIKENCLVCQVLKDRVEQWDKY